MSQLRMLWQENPVRYISLAKAQGSGHWEGHTSTWHDLVIKDGILIKLFMYSLKIL